MTDAAVEVVRRRCRSRHSRSRCPSRACRCRRRACRTHRCPGCRSRDPRRPLRPGSRPTHGEGPQAVRRDVGLLPLGRVAAGARGIGVPVDATVRRHHRSDTRRCAADRIEGDVAHVVVATDVSGVGAVPRRRRVPRAAARRIRAIAGHLPQADVAEPEVEDVAVGRGRPRDWSRRTESAPEEMDCCGSQAHSFGAVGLVDRRSRRRRTGCPGRTGDAAREQRPDGQLLRWRPGSSTMVVVSICQWPPSPQVSTKLPSALTSTSHIRWAPVGGAWYDQLSTGLSVLNASPQLVPM